MKANKINRRNSNLGSKSTDNIPVLSKHFNDLVDDVAFLYPVINKLFTGEVKLDKAFSHYYPYNVVTDVAIWPGVQREIGAYAELTLVADGSHTPAFDALFTETPSSEAWDTTDTTVHKVGFYYDGTYIYYTITVVA
jgi:hypothetical protein